MNRVFEHILWLQMIQLGTCVLKVLGISVQLLVQRMLHPQRNFSSRSSAPLMGNDDIITDDIITDDIITDDIIMDDIIMDDIIMDDIITELA